MLFGGFPHPPEFVVIAHHMVYTINGLLADITWDHIKVSSNKVSRISDPVPLPDNISYGHARDISVYITFEKTWKTDVCANDLITISHDSGDNLENSRRILVLW